jgi:hypothetical protein
MTNPVFVGMPAAERTFTVPKAGGGSWGRIICGGRCQDNYARIVIYNQPPAGGAPVKLQKAPMDSFRAAEADVGFVIALTGSWRSCAYQRELYNDDPSRYAHPDTTAHCRGLAIDVSQSLSLTRRAAIHKALTSRGWHQARADEPWHYSFGIQV